MRYVVEATLAYELALWVEAESEDAARERAAELCKKELHRVCGLIQLDVVTESEVIGEVMAYEEHE